MSLALIRSEIRRFLKSTDPEVLCIKGKWGVGKTYAWRKYLLEAQCAGDIGLRKYSYVSLFGLNSLDDLKFAIFESTISGGDLTVAPDEGTLSQLFAKGSDWARKGRPLLDLAAAVFNRKGIAEVLFKSAFVSVRKQLVCLDDLERAGTGLNAREVLGLVSSLKEDRGCKVVLLLNDEQLEGPNRTEFNRQLEKVADTTLNFDLSPQEATEIALNGTESPYPVLRERAQQLRITNIRVLKKIERLALKAVEILSDFNADTKDQALTAIVLGAWSVLQPDYAPPISFVRRFNYIVNSMRSARETLDPAEEKWTEAIAEYPYSETDELDAILLDGVEAGYFDESALKAAATLIEQRNQASLKSSEYSRVWSELFHGSLATDDDDFLDALHASAVAEAKYITVLNINSAVTVLREFGRSAEADDVISKYIEAHSEEPLEFFDLDKNHFLSPGEVDPALREAFAQRRQSYVDERDPLSVVKSMAESRSWKDADVALMAKQTPETFEKIFEALRGDELKGGIEILQVLGRAGLEESEHIHKAVVEALRRIALKSPIRARKVARFGVKIDIGAVQ